MESAVLSRRSFLRGRIRTVTPAQRPPWALDEAAFIERCTRCEACIEACPTAIVVAGEGGYPTVDFSRGECTFCAACATRCEPLALQRASAAEAPWKVRAAIGERCLAANGVECRVCGESCPTGAIRFRPRVGGAALPELTLSSCNGCGACFAPCPVGAIAVKAGEMDMASKEGT